MTAERKPLVKFKLDGEVYEIGRLTLDEGRLLKHEYGVEDLFTLNLKDPDVLAGVLEVAYRREHPEVTREDALAHIGQVDPYAFEALPEDPPTPAAAGDTENAAPEAGASEMTRETPGVPA